MSLCTSIEGLKAEQLAFQYNKIQFVVRKTSVACCTVHTRVINEMLLVTGDCIKSVPMSFERSF